MEGDGQTVDQIFSFALHFLDFPSRAVENANQLNTISGKDCIFLESKPVKKKKNRFKPYYIPVHSMPRIIKRDIRREYGKMLTNVLNLADEHMFTNFFRTFCSKPESYFTKLHSSRLNNTTRPAVIYTNGIFATVGQILIDLAPTPDIVFHLETAQIIRRPELTGCQIQLQMKVAATAVYMNECMLPNVDTLSHNLIPHYCYYQETAVEEDASVVKKKPRLEYHQQNDGTNTSSSWKDEENEKVEEETTKYLMQNIHHKPICRDTILYILDNQNTARENPSHPLHNHNHHHQDKLIPCAICQQLRRQYLPVPYPTTSMLEVKLHLNDAHQLSHMEVFST